VEAVVVDQLQQEMAFPHQDQEQMVELVNSVEMAVVVMVDSQSLE
jgi:hypothetical protein